MREILTASCGHDLRQASPATPLPSLDTPSTLKTLAANLEMAFGIEVPTHDLARLHTVRDVLQCVRLRRWEGRVSGGGARAATARPTRPIFVAPARDPRERFLRFTRRTASSAATPSPIRTAKRI